MSKPDTSPDELYQQVTDICFENGGVTKPMVDKLTALVSQRELALLERLESQSVTVLPETYPTGQRTSIDAVPMSAIQELREEEKE